jgi:anti-sigma regulatory factor (Ser/Thr protein kinase)
VEDEGRIAETPRKKPRQATGDMLPEGGLGLLIIESLMDDVQHQTGLESNTTLRMVKYARAAA